MAVDSKYGVVNLDGQIPSNEPIFILRAQDIFAIHLLKVYRGLRESTGDLTGVNSLNGTIDLFKKWIFKKVPD